MCSYLVSVYQMFNGHNTWKQTKKTNNFEHYTSESLIFLHILISVTFFLQTPRLWPLSQKSVSNWFANHFLFFCCVFCNWKWNTVTFALFSTHILSLLRCTFNDLLLLLFVSYLSCVFFLLLVCTLSLSQYVYLWVSVCLSLEFFTFGIHLMAHDKKTTYTIHWNVNRLTHSFTLFL